LHLWRDTAAERGCFEQSYAFANSQARFLFHRDELTSLHYTPHEEARCVVTMMSGLPGAGKDSWLARERRNLPVVSLDALREEMDVSATDNQGQVIQAAREACREHLRAHRDFAFNATNLSAQIRRRWIDLFASYNARIEIIYIEPPLAVILRQNREREACVPESVIARLLEKLEVPTLAEAHAVSLTG
jgi:predicted kinase